MYLVSPRRIAAIAASLILSGVSKSGSPTDRLMMSRPAAFNSVARAVIAMVGDGLTRARRSARKGMTGLRLQGDKHSILHAKPAGVKPVPAHARSGFCLTRQPRIAAFRPRPSSSIRVVQKKLNAPQVTVAGLDPASAHDLSWAWSDGFPIRGCPDQVRAKRALGASDAAVPNPIMSMELNRTAVLADPPSCLTG